MIDNLVALGARDDLLAVVTAWPALALLVAPQTAADTGPRVSGGDDAANRSPANLEALDLMHEIEDATRFYARVLIDETDDWAPTTSRMPGLLEDVADRYGHFTAGDDKTALDFCDWAHEAQRKVAGILSDREKARKTWFGPCQVEDCGGQLHARPGAISARCPVCGTEASMFTQRAYLREKLDAHLMTASEIASALKIEFEGDAPTFELVRSWISRKRLKPAEEGLYKLQDARALIRRKTLVEGLVT